MSDAPGGHSPSHSAAPSGPLPLEGEGLKAALAEAARRLTAVSDSPRLDAELLMAHALGLTREALLLGRDGEAPAAFEALIRRRLAHEPVSQITGKRGFWTIELAVTRDVLTPRPETELLMEAAVERFGDGGPERILDLGTGSGALLLAALTQWPNATGVGVDRSPAALAVAGHNAERLGLAERASLRLGDWGEGLGERFDLVLSNPPYIETGAALPPDVADHEPHVALFAGGDGLDDHRVLAGQIGGLLAPGGLAALEFGAGQGASMLALYDGVGRSRTLRRDLAGRERALVIAS